MKIKYKKLSYRRESAHLISLYRTVQKAFRYFEPFRRESRDWQTNSERSGQRELQKNDVAERSAER